MFLVLLIIFFCFHSLDRERDTIKKLQSEISDLKRKLSSASSAVSSPAPVKSNQQSSSFSNDLVADLREENDMLKELIAQLRTDLDLAVQLSANQEKTSQGKKHGPNYFIIGEADDNLAEEIQRVEDCLNAIISSEDVEFTDVVELNQFFKVDSGRRKFTQILESLMQEFSLLELSDNSFELLLYLINTTLTEMDTSDSSDLITAKILMRAASIVKRKTDNVFIQEFITSYSVYHDIRFWEELFWGLFSTIF